MLVNHIVFRAVARIGSMVTVSARGFGFTAARHGGRKPTVPPLTTLHPPLLQPSDFRSPSSRVQFRIRHEAPDRNTLAMVHYRFRNELFIPFPTDARGFFYFRPGPSHAPIAGELRFRIVPSGDPKAFDQGRDLMDTLQILPWSIPLATLLYYKTYQALAYLLVDANLYIPFPTSYSTGVVERFKQGDLQKAGMDANIVHSLGQPMLTNVNSKSTNYIVAKGDKLLEARNMGLFSDTRRQNRAMLSFAPYTGSIVYTLERALGHEEATSGSDSGSPCCVRVLDIVEPIRLVDPAYDGHLPPPVKGEILQRPGGGPRIIRKPELCSLPTLDFNDG